MQAENLYGVAGFVNRAGAWQNVAATPTHFLAPRAPIHEDRGRVHDASHVHFVLCDTGFNSSWSWHTRRSEVVRIGDRDDAGQIRVIQADENSSAWQSGIWIPRQFFKPDERHVRLHCEVDSVLS